MPVQSNQPLQFVLKLASRCNLNCSYCYVYNKGDETWRERPAFMSVEVIESAILRIRRHASRSRQKKIRIIFHGGEPCLIGPEAFDLVCSRIRTALADIGHVHLSLQTNGTLLNAEWSRVLRNHNIFVGISLDGPPEIHDRFRITHVGRPSYADVVAGLDALREAQVPFDLMTVIQPGSDGVATYRHLASLQPRSVNFLLPDYTHDDIGPVQDRFGPTPCANVLIPAFDEWWLNGSIGMRVGIFWSIARLIMGAESDVDLLGNMPLRFMFVETDGAIQPLDVLRICGNNFTATGLNVLTDDFSALAAQDSLLASIVFNGLPLGQACIRCPEKDTCGGGYLPHRFSRQRGFDNESVWCADLLALFHHIRQRLQVDVIETASRRAALSALAAEHAAMDIG